ncbi:ABC transporter permease [Belliella sp. DSM 111904]|uniref:ABC transporter permease n=1 Tax=Belliella filtrata TaxID=2923435 RepID=A0ABS9UVI2_9BACT|nr:ABC transporter permease [Belliella filtrata]MCH7408177.1 ABC transporter permease [Belliella filtrata]
MWKNYFIVSLRNLSKRKLYTGINILGLTVAMTSFLAISLYIHHEWSYDKMYSDYQRIYKFNQEFTSNGETQLVSTTPSSLAPTMMDEISEIELATLVFDLSIFSSVVVEIEGELFEEPKFAYVDENFFHVFDFDLIHGNPKSVLSEPFQLVLPKSTAARYFRNVSDAIGKTVQVEGENYTITGIMEDFPSNSHLEFGLLASFKTHRHGKTPAWSPSNYYTYAKFRENSAPESVESKLDQIVDKYFGEDMASYGFSTRFFIQPVSSIHLGGNTLKSIKPTSDSKYIYIFALVGILLIVIGIINYVNLATAEATERNKEVGLRKILGAERFQLFGQFVSESFILTSIAILVSILALNIISGYFESFASTPLNLSLLLSFEGISFLVLLFVLIGFISGIYPAVILSGMAPLHALGKQTTIGNGAWMRKGLVVFQFFVSIGLLLATLIVKNQLNYMQEVNLGYDREEVIALNLHYKMHGEVESFKNELVRQGIAQSVSKASDLPIYIKASYSITPGWDNDKEFMITGYSTDHELVNTIGLELAAGEDLAPTDPTRWQAYEQGIELPVLLNEAAVRELGWESADAVGRKLNFGDELVRVKGVVKDFYFNSLHHQVSPLAIFVDPDGSNVILTKLMKGNPATQLAAMETVWASIFPSRPFVFKFVDEEYARMYQYETMVGKVFSLFAGIAIFIACMGLFGLVSYVALRRTREISIRKVLGANTFDILRVLSADFFSLLGISALLAVGFGYWFSEQWMQDFAYKSTVSVSIYLISIASVAFIAFFTIVYRTVKVYQTNPAETLKDG